MRPVILIGHADYETFGVAPETFRDADVPWIEHLAHAGAELPDLSQISGIALYGGEMNVDMGERYPFLSDERIYVRKAIDAGVPYLGICLGAQMLARALDHPVHPAGIREFGFNPLRPTLAAADDELSLARNILAEQQAQQRGLSGAARTGEEDELPLVHAKREVAQRVDAASVDLRDVRGLDHGIRGSPRRLLMTACARPRPGISAGGC